MSNDYDLRRLQLMQLDILKEVKRVCEIHGFTFYLAYGSCLGAVRHHGAIPWDDDMDIIMYVDDYDRFVKCQDDFDDRFFIQTMETDPEFRTIIARVRLAGTTIIEKEFIDCNINQGVFIDIYPLYGYPKNKIAGRIFSWRSLLYRMLIAGGAPKNHGKCAKAIGNTICKVMPEKSKKKFINSFYKKLRERLRDSRYVADLYGMDVGFMHTIRYERSWFGDPSMVTYEGIQFPAPTDCDKYLRCRYGDYMQLPPEGERNSYHSFEFVDLDHSYLDYKGRMYLMNDS